MYVEYDSERVFFFLPSAAFFGALADFLEGVLAIVMSVIALQCWARHKPRSNFRSGRVSFMLKLWRSVGASAP